MADEAVHEALIKATDDGGDPIAIAVVGANGNLIAFAAMDGVLPASIAIAQHKAFTSVALRKDTLDHHRADPPKNPANYGDLRICFMAGGVVVRYRGQVIGGIGVSGRKAFRPDRQTDEAGFEDPILTDHELATAACLKALPM